MKMSEIDISVVIPTYNSGDFILETLNSVKAQEGVNLELIVVDDLGQDNTREVLQAFKAAVSFPVHLIFRDSPQGQATARNLGIDRAVGRYVAFLDSDDQFGSSTALAEWLAFASSLDLDIACAQFIVVSKRGTAPGRHLPIPPHQPTSARDWPRLANMSSFWQCLYRRNYLDGKNIRFSDRLRQREDRPFFLDALLKAERIGVTDSSFIHHYIRDESSFRTKSINQLEQFCVHCELVSNTLNSGLSDGRFSADLIQINLCIYYTNLIDYWGPLLSDLWESAEGERLVRKLLALYKTFPRSVAPLYRTDAVRMSGAGETLQMEGDIDILHYLVNADNHELAMRVISRKRVPLDAVFGLGPDLDPDVEEGICRYLSFNRTQPHFVERPLGEIPALHELVRRVVIHVGPPKTGSSVVQQSLERNRFALLRAGYHYPVTGANRERGLRRERTPGHAYLIDRLSRGDAQLLDELRAEIWTLPCAIHTLILSSENIVSTRFWRGGEIIELLANALAPAEIEFVYVPREFEDWFPSYFKESCSNPWNMTTHSPGSLFSELVAEGVLEPPDRIERRLLAPENVKKVHRESYGTLLKEGRLLSWFLEKIGFPGKLPSDVDVRLSNRSLSDEAAAILLVAKKMKLNRTRMDAIFSYLVESEDLRNKSFKLMPEETAAKIGRSYANYLRQLDAGGVGTGQANFAADAEIEPAEAVAATEAMTSSLTIPRPVWKHFLEHSTGQRQLGRIPGEMGAISLRLDSRLDEIRFNKAAFIVYPKIIQEIERASSRETIPKADNFVLHAPPTLALSGSLTFGGGWHETVLHIGPKSRNDGTGIYVRRNHQNSSFEVRLYTAYTNFADHTLVAIPCETGRQYELRVHIGAGMIDVALNDERSSRAITTTDYRWHRNTEMRIGNNIHAEADFLRKGDDFVIVLERFTLA